MTGNPGEKQLNPFKTAVVINHKKFVFKFSLYAQ